MSDLPTTKPELAALRADLIERVNHPNIPPANKMELQAQLTRVNAAIKHLNTMAAADAKLAAAARKADGLLEAQANLARNQAYQAGLPPTTVRDEGILVRAKVLHRELTRTVPLPQHFQELLGPLGKFIDIQKARMKPMAALDENSIAKTQSEPTDPEWHKTWADK